MDQATRESRLARCTTLWAAATNFRNHRTHQQDQQHRRNQRKATALDNLAEATVTAATVAIAVIVNHLFPTPADDYQIIAILSVSFIGLGLLARMTTAVFGPTIDRLRGIETNGDQQ